MGNYNIIYSEIKKINNNEFEIIIKNKIYSNYIYLNNSYIIKKFKITKETTNLELLNFMIKYKNNISENHYIYLLRKIENYK
jgi:hypothetical protein